jgi:hypothetical protein
VEWVKRKLTDFYWWRISRKAKRFRDMLDAVYDELTENDYEGTTIVNTLTAITPVIARKVF